MQASAYALKSSQINRLKKKKVLPTPVGKNIIICAKNIKHTGFNNADAEKDIFSFGETRTRKSTFLTEISKKYPHTQFI